MLGAQGPVYHQNVPFEDAQLDFRDSSNHSHEGGRRVDGQEVIKVVALDRKVSRWRQNPRRYSALDTGRATRIPGSKAIASGGILYIRLV